MVIQFRSDNKTKARIVEATDSESPREHVERVYAQFREGVRQFLWRKARSSSLAEEFTQIVYLRLLNCQTLATVKNPEGYIYTIARNVLRDEMKRGAYEKGFSVSLPDTKIDAAVAANRDLWVDNSTEEVDKQYLLNGIASLSPEHREVFELHYIDLLTVEQISEKTGVNVHTVKKHIAKVLAHLHAHYGDDSDPSGTTAKERT
jgi:RNA polymerase sigma factor (sigma-70 family)